MPDLSITGQELYILMGCANTIRLYDSTFSKERDRLKSDMAKQLFDQLAAGIDNEQTRYLLR